MSSPPEKRQRTESVSITRSTIWYKDGSVVLQAHNTQFRVHWSILSQHSSFFCDMQDLPQPPDQDSVEGCPVVELLDSVTDVEEMLKVLYNPALFNENNLPFQTIASLVRLGRKYDFKDLLQIAVDRLHYECPSSLQEYDAVFHSEKSPARIKWYPGIYFDIIGLARESAIHSLLPCAYLRAALLATVWMFDGLLREDGTRIVLSPADQKACVIGREKLLLGQWERDNTLGWCHETCEDCLDPVRCTSKKNQLFRSHVLAGALYALSTVSTAEKNFASKHLCPSCQKALKTMMTNGRGKMWEELPAFFGLPPWSELQDAL
ncbi:hypothetical protein C8R43DRAFT_982058 [Mycena crocata]|nr:hypothetical protein C8R43DRAFT_982058 [Mycena crocata]